MHLYSLGSKYWRGDNADLFAASLIPVANFLQISIYLLSRPTGPADVFIHFSLRANYLSLTNDSLPLIL